MQVSRLLRAARRRSGLSARALAELAGTSHATVLAYESGRKVPRTDTFLRLLDAAGFEAEVELATRPDRDHLSRVAKGEELVRVLELAAAFPASPEPHASYPRFGRAS